MGNNLIKSIIFSGFLPQSALAQTSVIHAGELLVMAGNTPLQKQTLVITNDKISAIKSGFILVSNFSDDA